jgi:hypothetical protein
LLTHALPPVRDRHFLLATRWAPSPFGYYADKLRGDPGWSVIEMATGHDIMVDMPLELAAVIDDVAAAIA